MAGRKATFSFTDEVKDFLRQCLETAVDEAEAEHMKVAEQQTRLLQLFRSKFPDCKLKKATLWEYARRELNDIPLPSMDRDQVVLWTPERIQFLQECIPIAIQKNRVRYAQGFSAGKVGAHGEYQAILTQLFNQRFPEFSTTQINSQRIHLGRQGLLEENGDIPEPVEDEVLAIIMSYWQRGHDFTLQPLFRAICVRCSRLIPKIPTSTNSIKTIEQTNSDACHRLPLFNHYPADVLATAPPSQPNARATRFYVCSTCLSRVRSFLSIFSMTNSPGAPDMIQPLPNEFINANRVEKSSVALTGLWSKTAKYPSGAFGIYQHNEGETNILHKNDQRYLEMYVMMIEKVTEEIADQDTVRKMLLWLKQHNHLLKRFYAHYETLYRFVNSNPGDPRGVVVYGSTIFQPARTKRTKLDILGDLEDVGVLLPAYDIGARNISIEQMVAALQHVKDVDYETARQMHVDFTKVPYGSKHLEEKTWPCLFLYGVGGYFKPESEGISRPAYVKWRLMQLLPFFRREPTWYFFQLDHIIKDMITYHNAVTVRVKELVEPFTNQELQPTAAAGYDPYNRYGTKVPMQIPGSRGQMAIASLDLCALRMYKKRIPDYFITLTQNDQWPELIAVMGDRTGASWQPKLKVEYESRKNAGEPGNWCPRVQKEYAAFLARGESPVDYPMEMVVAFFNRLQFYVDIFFRVWNPVLGIVEDYFIRIEFQKRGGLHAHMVAWCQPGTHSPEKVVCATMPRFDHPCNNEWGERVKKFQIHVCRDNYCKNGPNGTMLQHCKHHFPFDMCDCIKLDPTGVRYLYPRYQLEDAWISPYNLPMSLAWGGHVNIQMVTDCGFDCYLCKYIAKSAHPEVVALYLNHPYTSTKEPLSRQKASVVVPVADPDPKNYIAKVLLPATPAKKTNLREGARDTDTKRFLQTRMTSSLEAMTILMGEPLIRCSREFVFLPIELDPDTRIIKRPEHRVNLQLDSPDIYGKLKIEKYFRRPEELADVTYPQYYSEYYFTVQKRKPKSAGLGSESEEDNRGDEELESPRKRQCVSLWKDKDGRCIAKRQNPGRYAVTRFRSYDPWGKDMEMYCLQKLLQQFPATEATVEQWSKPSFLQTCLDLKVIDKLKEGELFLENAACRGWNIAKLQETARKLMEGGFVAHQDIDGLLETVVPGRKQMEASIQARVTDYDNDPECAGHNVANPQRIPLEEFLENFTTSQARGFKWITDRWRKGQRVLCMITGPAGTGKSFLMKALSTYCLDNNMPVLKSATTGQAGLLIGGTTIYSMLGLNFNRESRLQKGTVDAHMIRASKVIFIDEVSMLDAPLLKQMNELLVEHSGIPTTFGNKSILLFGDPAQLPPVQRHIWTQESFGSFSLIMLREVKRQTDPAFIALLNRVRLGEITDSDFELLKAREIPESAIGGLDLSKGSVLYPTRVKRTNYNQGQLDRLSGQSRTYVATDVNQSGQPLKPSPSTIDYISWLDGKGTIPPKELELKVGAKVILLRNVDMRHGWCNGQMGIVTALTEDYVEIESIEQPRRKIVLFRMKHDIPFPNKAEKNSRYQFPLILGYAMTVHKAQGVTLLVVVIDGTGCFTSGQFYTAVSRSSSYENLYFIGLDRKSIFIAPGYKLLLEWMDRVDVLRPGYVDGVKREAMPFVPFPYPFQDKYHGKRSKSAKTQRKRRRAETDLPNQLLAEEPAPTLRVFDKTGIWIDADANGNIPSLEPSERFLNQIEEISVHRPHMSEQTFLEQLHKLRLENHELLTTIRQSIGTAGDVFYDCLNMLSDIHSESCYGLYMAMRKHYYAMKTESDCNSLFRAFSWTLFGTDTRFLDLRLMCCFAFVDYWPEFAKKLSSLTGAGSLRTLIENTAKCREVHHARFRPERIHLAAIAALAARPVFVYEAFNLTSAAGYDHLTDDEVQAEISSFARGASHSAFLPVTPKLHNFRPLCILMAKSGLYSGMLPRRKCSRIFQIPQKSNETVLPPPSQVSSSQMPQDLCQTWCRNNFGVQCPTMIGTLSGIVGSASTSYDNNLFRDTLAPTTPAVSTRSDSMPVISRNRAELLLDQIFAVLLPTSSRDDNQLSSYLMAVKTHLDQCEPSLQTFRNLARSTSPVQFQPSHRMLVDDREATKLYKIMRSDYAVMDTEADGHCCYHALSWTLFGHPNYHHHLRILSIQIFVEFSVFFLTVGRFLADEGLPALIKTTARIRGTVFQIGWGSGSNMKAIAMATDKIIFSYRGLHNPGSFDNFSRKQVEHHIVEYFGPGVHELKPTLDTAIEHNLHHAYYPLPDIVPRGRPICVLFLEYGHFLGMLPRSPIAHVYHVKFRADLHYQEHNEPPIRLDEIEITC